MMFWDIKKLDDIKTNTIEFKMADKMADKISKPLNLRAKKANIVFNNVYSYAFLPILIKA